MNCQCGQRARPWRKVYKHRGWPWRGKLFHTWSTIEGLKCKKCRELIFYPVDGSAYRAEVEQIRARLKAEGEPDI